MSNKHMPGLGELLRYVGEMVDQGAEEEYRAMKLPYRARYTPIMRALAAGAETVTEITARCSLTQGAISQSVRLMEADGLVARHSLEDGRKNGVHLTPRGQELLKRLEPQWAITFAAIGALEKEIGHPLLEVLAKTARALEREGFASRLRAAAAHHANEDHVDAE
ncbi:MarR family transcriptional regulator [Ensifer sp. IC4062]|nr:MarR family transcriptional regulator [Ensifer sp. IC4062]